MPTICSNGKAGKCTFSLSSVLQTPVEWNRDIVHPGDSRGATALSWADRANSLFLENILMSEALFVNKPLGSRDKAFSKALRTRRPSHHSVASLAQAPAALPQSVLIEYCEQAAEKAVSSCPSHLCQAHETPYGFALTLDGHWDCQLSGSPQCPPGHPS